MIYRPEIRFADIDSYGIVHNAKYLLFFEQARIRLFYKVSENWDWSKSGILVASQKVEYRHPVVLSDKLEIITWVQSMGSKSLTIAYEAYVVKGEEKVLSAESKTVIVCFNPLTKQTELIPEVWRSSIEEHSLMSKPSMC